jgi:hypothetical protein
MTARHLKVQLILKLPEPGTAYRELVARLQDSNMIVFTVWFNALYFFDSDNI